MVKSTYGIGWDNPCAKCVKDAERKRKHPIIDEVDCNNCESLESCLHWLWYGNMPEEGTKKRAEDCECFARIGFHKVRTCGRGDI